MVICLSILYAFTSYPKQYLSPSLIAFIISSLDWIIWCQSHFAVNSSPRLELRSSEPVTYWYQICVCTFWLQIRQTTFNHMISILLALTEFYSEFLLKNSCKRNNVIILKSLTVRHQRHWGVWKAHVFLILQMCLFLLPRSLFLRRHVWMYHVQSPVWTPYC